jgi:flagellar biosynthesis/type III secretory pathway chaperone
MTEQLARAAAVLAEVLAAENAALAALDFPRVGALLAAKNSAAEAFAAAHAATQATAQRTGQRTGQRIGQTTTPNRTPSLAATALHRLRALVLENQRLLEAAIKVQGRVIGVIAHAVTKALRPPTTLRYGAHGRATASRPSACTLSARA